MIADGIAELVPVAQRAGVRLGVEALHPMFCADRCAISRLGDAVDLALQFPADAVGVVIDTYHVWWDSHVGSDIARAAGRIATWAGGAMAACVARATPRAVAIVCSAAKAGVPARSDRLLRARGVVCDTRGICRPFLPGDGLSGVGADGRVGGCRIGVP